jgi:two-component system, sensor histidine kinase
MTKQNSVSLQGLPWWTWVLPLLLFHAGTQLSLRFQITPGVAILYLPVPIALALVHWWGPRILLGLYANALFSAGLWGLPRWELWPLYALPEVLEVGLSWLFFTRLAQGECSLPNLRHTMLFIGLGMVAPIALAVPYLTGQLVFFGDVPHADLILTAGSQGIADLLGAFALAVPALYFATPWLRRNRHLGVTDSPWPRPPSS